VNDKDLVEIKKAAGDIPLSKVINELLDAVDPDKQIEKAKQMFKTDTPSEDQVKKAMKELTKVARLPFDRPEFRDTILRIKQRNEQIIDRLSKDEVLLADFDRHARDRSEEIVTNFKKFIEEKKDEIIALQIIYNMPYNKQRLTFEETKELAEAIQMPPYQLSADLVWKAYEQLDRSRVKGAGPARILTDLIALVRFALGKDALLMPFKESIDKRFGDWIAGQERSGETFTQEQTEWLLMIKNHIAASLSISIEDLEYTPFDKKGGAIRLQKIFGKDALDVLEQLTTVLTP
jgi:type I restriction enzyme R subunit